MYSDKWGLMYVAALVASPCSPLFRFLLASPKLQTNCNADKM